ncbi:MAG: glutamate 5-kinase [Actinomycetota bacterium]|nr:glutamate 5-kinase [Actinomycetota bacterium]MDA8167245.1 glutamate 5-kinase [Actinomycetota bacterium]
MSKTCVVKIGSNTLTDEGGCLREEALVAITDQIIAFVKQGNSAVVVSSGAISCGLGMLPVSKRPRETVELQAVSAVGQGRLYHRYYELFRRGGVTTAQILLTSYDIAARSQYLNARGTLLKLREWGIVPIINENDTTSADEIRYGDNDFLAAQVAMLIKADLLLLLTDTEGLYTGDPSVDPAARLIEEVSDWSLLEGIETGGAGTAIGSGGMKSKVVAAEMATSAGIEVVIASGARPGVITAAARGEQAGTRFVPLESSISSFKLWLKYGRPSSGAVLVDDGAAAALVGRGTSLLAAGIVGVEGEFDAGEAIDVLRASDRELIGKGIVTYAAGELEQIKGLKSSRVMELMPHGDEEVIHRDYFVLTEG